MHPGLLGKWPIVLVGIMIPATDTAAGRNTMEENLLDAYRAIAGSASGTLQQTPSGAALRSLTVYGQIPVAVSGGFRKTFAFGLVSTNTDWA